MAQPIYFAPGYMSPTRIRMEESMLKAQIIQQGMENVSGAIQGYFDNKTKSKYEKLGTMNALLSTYGSEALGPHFQNEYGSLLHTVGIDMPQDETGLYKISPSFEDKLKGHILQHPELIPALLGTQRPDLSPGEIHYRDQEVRVKEEAVNARLEAADIMAKARDEATNARLQGIEMAITGKHEDVATTVAGRTAAAQAAAAAKPGAAPSGMYNYKSKLISAAVVDANPGKYEGAYPLNAGQYQMMLNNKKTREMTTDLATKTSLMEQKIRGDLENDQLKPFLMTIGAAVKAKNKPLTDAVLSHMAAQLNQVEGIGLTEQEMSSPGFIGFLKTTIMPILSNSVPNATQAAPKTDKPQAPAPREVKLPDGTIIYEQAHP